MIQINKRAISDVNRIRAKLLTAVKDIRLDTEAVVVETGETAFNFALSVAPEYTGALKRAMTLRFPTLDEFEIVSRHPAGDLLPINILFDTGDYPSVTGNKPRKSNSLFFMQQTLVFAEQEFNRRLKNAIRRDIEKIGRSKGGK